MPEAREPAGTPDRDEEDLMVVFMPPLAELLANLERRKGAPLTEEEVLDARDRAVCLTMRRSRALRLVEARGYADIDPEDAWRAWQAFRRS